MEQKYDSTENTKKHIKRVQELLLEIQLNLARRAAIHDRTKLESPEKEAYDFIDPILHTLRYGTPEYEECLLKVEEARRHHFNNSLHHPESFYRRIRGMSLLSIIEMLADWRVASEKPTGGNFRESVEYNIKKYNINDDLAEIFRNTVLEMGW